MEPKSLFSTSLVMNQIRNLYKATCAFELLMISSKLVHYDCYKGNNRFQHGGVNSFCMVSTTIGSTTIGSKTIARKTIGSHNTALQVFIAVTVEVVAWRTRKLLEIFVLYVRDVFCWLAFTILSIFAAKVAEVLLLLTLTPQQTILEADGTTALLRNTIII